MKNEQDKINSTKKDIFIIKSKELHKNDFDYSNFTYVDSKTKSIITCNKCKIQFESTPSNHLQGKGCKNCHTIKVSKEYIDKKLSELYKNFKFDLTNYKNRDSIIYFICDKGHRNKRKVKSILRYNPCHLCIGDNLESQKLERITKNNLSITKYKSDNNIECICKSCNYHIIDNYRNLTYKKFKCKYCNLINKSDLLRNKEIILISFEENSMLKLKCKEGHVYNQNILNLLANKKCKICYDNKRKIDKEKLLELFNSKHGAEYIYCLDTYKNLHSKIEIKCIKNHIFYQKVSNHLQGKGCPICRESKGEKAINRILKNKKVIFEKQKKFENCVYKSQLLFDFYLPEFNTCIEFDGIQHYKTVELFGGKKGFEETKIRDEIKNEYCINNNIHLIRISYKEIDNIEELLINELIILQSQVSCI